MLNWFKGKTKPAASGKVLLRAFCMDGVVIGGSEINLPADSWDPTRIEAQGTEDLLAQLDDEGLTIPHGEAVMIPWDHVFEVLETPEYRGCRDLLGLPKDTNCVPVLQSHKTLTDRNFSVMVAGWHDATGEKLSDLHVCGGVSRLGQEFALLSRAVWETLSQIARFQRRPDIERDPISNRRYWGQIRRSAIDAGARLDGFLFRNIVLTPEKLDIGLRANQAGGTRVVEIIPSFQGAPENWISEFDKRPTIPELYNIPSQDGIIQVLISPPVKTVLDNIKRLPGRRVAGARAEAFLINPYAALGEAASETIDETQFLSAREQAGILFERFVAHIKRDALSYPIEVGLQIAASKPGGQVESEIHLFADDDALKQFIGDVERAVLAGRQLCAWQGYDFELLGETTQELDLLKEALKKRGAPQILVSYATIYDLSLYASRIETIGVEKPYYSPFIAKKDDGEGWFPDNIVPVISWTPDGELEPVAVPITPEAKEQLQAKIEEAKAKDEESFELAGFDKPMSVRDAEFILKTFADLHADARAGTFDPEVPRNDSVSRPRTQLVIKANIQGIDYEEARRDVLRSPPETLNLPRGLQQEVTLKDHQLSGVAWLQHLFGNAPHHCRGAVLADDMGLGKTLQLLTFLAWIFEQDPSLPPALIVAPVSLLENWEKEAKKFLVPGALSLLTAYGDSLSKLRVPRDSIDMQLQADGLVKFLNSGWRGAANVVLTTYETLRDLEFSFGAEKWSVMICDEAQRIKNPNAMVTRAAKKQNVNFRIACTGTPVENTLADLWCLFDFVQPGLLGALNDFGRRYRRPIEAQTEEEKARVEELRELIAPQILRRTKALPEIAKDLKGKENVPSRIPLSAHQRTLYANAIDLFKRRDEPAVASPFKNHLGLLHYLRLICTDPRRIGLNVFRPEPLDDYRARAPKLDWLITTLRKIHATGEKAIVFCEFREMQRMLRHYIEEVFGFAPDIINGDISASANHISSRQKRIEAFQAKPGFGVIILSPVAVGFGVNIQEANHVIHYTRTWNPAKEDQATDRAYRIGQTRKVWVYCPVVYAEDFTTFDVKLDLLLSIKRSLAEDMLNGSGDVGPGDFGLADVGPNADGKDFSTTITLDDVLQMRWDYFECLIAAIWRKKGYKTVYRTPQQDDGVDVVALSGSTGVLLQCKTSSSDKSSLGWDAVKEVVAGEAAYRMRHPGVDFRRVCVTNQFFNSTARTHAELNNVELLSQSDICVILEAFPVTTHDIESLLYATWD